MPGGLQRWSKVGYPNGMERQAIGIRFSLPVASANSLHSLSKARVRRVSTRDCEIVITGRKLHRYRLIRHIASKIAGPSSFAQNTNHFPDFLPQCTPRCNVKILATIPVRLILHSRDAAAQCPSGKSTVGR